MIRSRAVTSWWWRVVPAGELAGGGCPPWRFGWTAVIGGLACVVAVVALALGQRGFLRYDARHPVP